MLRNTEKRHYNQILCSTILISILGLSYFTYGADAPQWGAYGTRNQISEEKNIPVHFQVPSFNHATNQFNVSEDPVIKFSVRMGNQAHGVPVVSGGKVLVGTNNTASEDNRFPDHYDYGVLMCMDDKTGKMLWKLMSPKFLKLKYADWWYIGQCATPAIEGNTAYLVSSYGEVLALDMNGLNDGKNDGPFQDEFERMFPDEDDRRGKKLESYDADILWCVNLYETLGVHQHNCANCSILLLNDYLYVGTGNGCEFSHSKTSNPLAPSLVVLEKKTGKIVARDDFNINGNVFHGQWSSPTLYTDRNGRKRIIYGAGNGYLYGFAPYQPIHHKKMKSYHSESEEPSTPEEKLNSQEKDPAHNIQTNLEKISPLWLFNGHPDAQVKEDVPIEHGHYSTSYFVVGNPVFAHGKIYVPVTQNVFHGPDKGWFICIDPNAALDKNGNESAETVDITHSGLKWSQNIGACVCTPAVYDGLLYTIAHDGTLYCLDAETGVKYWEKRLGGPAWGAPLAVDGKIYVGTSRRILYVLQHGKKYNELAHNRCYGKILCSCTAANKTLYLLTYGAFYAIKNN